MPGPERPIPEEARKPKQEIRTEKTDAVLRKIFDAQPDLLKAPESQRKNKGWKGERPAEIVNGADDPGLKLARSFFSEALKHVSSLVVTRFGQTGTSADDFRMWRKQPRQELPSSGHPDRGMNEDISLWVGGAAPGQVDQFIAEVKKNPDVVVESRQVEVPRTNFPYVRGEHYDEWTVLRKAEK